MQGIDLFNGLKNGDRIIITSIYRDVFPKVKHWVIRNNGTSQDAADVFQEVLETIILKINTLENSFEGLILQMTKYKWIDKIRKNKTARKFEEQLNKTEMIENENQIIVAEKEYIKYKLLEKHFTELSAICQALILKIKEGIKVADIVKDLEFKSANTLYRRKAACMERWSSLIKSDKNYLLLNE